MASYIRAINFSILLVFLLMIWVSIGVGIAVIRGREDSLNKTIKRILQGGSVGRSGPSQLFAAYVIGTFGVSWVLALAVIATSLSQDGVAVLMVLFPQAFLLWDFAAWFPVEVSAVLGMLLFLLVILIRQRGLAI